MTSTNFWEGGDFMERVDVGPKGPQKLTQTIHVEGRVPGNSEDPFPKVVGRTASVPTIDPDALAIMRLDWEGPNGR